MTEDKIYMTDHDHDVLNWFIDNGGKARVNYHIGVEAGGEFSTYPIKDFIRLERLGFVKFTDSNGRKRNVIEVIK